MESSILWITFSVRSNYWFCGENFYFFYHICIFLELLDFHGTGGCLAVSDSFILHFLSSAAHHLPRFPSLECM